MGLYVLEQKIFRGVSGGTDVNRCDFHLEDFYCGCYFWFF